MKTRPATSRDVKEARNALLKNLADLPLSGLGRAKALASPRKPTLVRAEPEKAEAKA
jgi:hypothetical protein